MPTKPQRLRDEAIATTTVIPEIVGLAATVGRLPQDAVIVPFRTVDGEDMVVVARDPLPPARVVVVLETRMDVTATSHRRDVAVIRSRDVAQAVDHCLVHARARARVVPSHPVDALRLRLDRGTHERDRDLLAALAIDDVVLGIAAPRLARLSGGRPHRSEGGGLPRPTCRRIVVDAVIPRRVP